MSTRQDSTLATNDVQTDKLQGYATLLITESGREKPGKTPLHVPLAGSIGLENGITECNAVHTEQVDRGEARAMLEAGDAEFCGNCRWSE